MNNIKNITIALCEGPHDTAFLYRILKTRCFKRFGGTLDNLPEVVGKFIVKNNKMADYEKLKIGSLYNEFVPNILYKNESLILLYSMGGDKKQKERLIVLTHFFENVKSQVEDTENYGDTWIEENKEQEAYYYNFLFFYDADNDKEAKITMVNNDLIKINIEQTLSHNQVIEKDGYSIGAYIFSNENDKGALEDVLFEIMKKDNETIFNKAEEYYKTYLNKDNNMNDIGRTKRLVTECVEGTPKDKRKDKKQEDEKKSVICIAGQLQKKGKANTVIIEDSDYLNLEKIQSSQQLQEIANLFDK
ncbi:MAG TPA: hypothetical protein ENK66_05055 [Arcobacter sp.]|nr:hypothetical protein [Arcobacter sp.]